MAAGAASIWLLRAMRIAGGVVFVAIFVSVAMGTPGNGYRLKLTAADQTAARSAVVHSSDLPADWTGGGTSPDLSGAACARLSDLTATGATESDWQHETNSGLTRYIHARAVIFKSPRMVTSDFQRTATARYETCTLHGYSHVSALRVSLPDIAKLARAYRVSYETTAFSQTVPVVSEVVEVGKGRTRLRVEEDSPSPISPGVLQADAVRLARIMLHRSRA